MAMSITNDSKTCPIAAGTAGTKRSGTAGWLALALTLTIALPAQAQSRYGNGAHIAAPAPHPATHQQPYIAARYAQPAAPRPMVRQPMMRPLYQPRPNMGQNRAVNAPLPRFQQWVEQEPSYTLVPGDQLDIVVGSAPELSRTLTVGPDGRVVMPMSEPVMAAGQTFTQVQTALMAELAKQLRDPRVAVTPRAYAPEQIYVGGQVGQPGTYTLPSRIGAIEAIFMAGGLSQTAKAKQIAILRRSAQGGMMLRTVNLRGGLKNIQAYDDVHRLRRGDIVFVPQSTIGEVGQFVQNFRNALPIDFNLSYQIGSGGSGATTVITP